GGAKLYSSGALPYFEEKRQNGAIAYSCGAQLYSVGAKHVEYSKSPKRVLWIQLILSQEQRFSSKSTKKLIDMFSRTDKTIAMFPRP
ncbi:MAG: hypothetical protein PHT39_09960, partial [Sphaerochaetaceae bacterium]|nr:hypothetical protein [Sphaerochaetaceae bacterium]